MKIVDRRNLDFVLFEVLGLTSLLSSPRYDHCDEEMVGAILDTAEAIAEANFLPSAAILDAQEPRLEGGRIAILPEVGSALQEYARAGFFSAGFDFGDGGQQLPYLVTSSANGIFTCANLGISGYAFLTTAAANLLAAFGSADQRAAFLPPMLEGRWFGTMCLSEPHAGSSLVDIRTKAEPAEDGHFRISGTKMWISGGDHEIADNIVHMVLAKVPGGPPGAKGISLFIVPKYRLDADGAPSLRNDISLVSLNHKMGQRGITNCQLSFGDNGDCHGYLVGELHQGLNYMFHMMNEARIGVGYGSVMSALAGYLYSFDYAQTRPQGRSPSNKDPLSPQVPIIRHTDVRRMLMAQKAAVEGALALCCYCASLVDRQRIETDVARRDDYGLLLEILTPIAKSWPSEHCLEANKHAIQILGGYGYTREYPVERFYRDNRLNHIHEGTFAIHGLDLLGRKMRMRGGHALTVLLTEIAATIERARTIPVLAAEAEQLDLLAGLARSTTARLLACTDPELSMANATIYLDAMGHLVIGWMWLLQASVAAKGAAGESPFHAGKIKGCRYFFRYELPKAENQFHLVASLDDVCLTVADLELVCA